ncbi:MAG: DNA cytosine methyltransferase [Desulfatirhabdiaceae bacterium]
MNSRIPVIDIFAGPGGLGEGFSLVDGENGIPFYRIALSVEKDPIACKTLKLRHFLRQFPPRDLPPEYYGYLRQQKNPEEIYQIKKYATQAIKADESVWHVELGGNSAVDAELDRRIADILKGNDKWVLIGGPPCQAYSVVGRSRNSGIKNYVPGDDPRHFLYREYIRIIAKHKPAIFVMENVKGLLSSKIDDKRIFDEILCSLKNPCNDNKQPKQRNSLRYSLYSISTEPHYMDDEGNPVYQRPTDFIVEPEKYEIPQARHRVILIGVRHDLTEKGLSPDILNPSDRMVSVQDVIAGMPQIRSGLSKKNSGITDSKTAWLKTVKSTLIRSDENGFGKIVSPELADKIDEVITTIKIPEADTGGEYISGNYGANSYLLGWFKDDQLKGVLNHSYRLHMASDLHRYMFAACFAEIIKMSPKISDFPDYLQPAHKNRQNNKFNDRFRVQLSWRYATTVTSHISKDGHYFIHYDPYQCRSLTVREAARLQTFKDNYFFCGNRTQQYIQVGNAVPPLLSYQIAKNISRLLEKSD